MKKILSYKNLFLFIFTLFFVSISILEAGDYSKATKAKVRFLNKHTGKTELATLTIGKKYRFDEHLQVALRACYKSSIQDDPENKAFLQVVKTIKKNNQGDVMKTLNLPLPEDFKISTKEDEAYAFIFSGWLFSSSPSVNYLEDKIYDITLLQCNM